MSNALIDDFPPIYRDLLPDHFFESGLNEEFATCNNCVMVSHPDAEKAFTSDLKCCSYYPDLPNFLVGGILSGGESEGRRRILEMIRSGEGVSPLGVYQLPAYRRLYSSKEGVFGKNSDLRCPYFDLTESNCTIWQFRDAVCSTWYCVSVAGEEGAVYWDAVKKYLLHTQRTLSDYVLRELGVANITEEKPSRPRRNLSALKILTPSFLRKRSARSNELKKRWGAWYGKEEDFFRQAFELVSGLTQADYLTLAGQRERELRQMIVKQRDSIEDIPQVLKWTDHSAERVSKEPASSVSIDGIKLDLPDCVPSYFDGSTTWEESLKNLADNEEIYLDRDLISSLYHYKVLADPVMP